MVDACPRRRSSTALHARVHISDLSSVPVAGQILNLRFGQALGRGSTSARSDVAAHHPLLLTLVTAAQALAELLGGLAFHCQLARVSHRRRTRCPLAAAFGIALGWLHILRLHVFDVVDELARIGQAHRDISDRGVNR